MGGAERNMAINNAVIMGRITHPLELKSTQNGIEYLNFTVAVDRRYQNKNEERKADFIDCQAWRQTAVFISKYFDKGSMIAVTGSIETDTYEDKNGTKRKSWKIAVEQVSFCGSKSEGGADYSPAVAQPAAATTTASAPNLDVDYDEDDLPF